jgi:hypothetical protein
MPLEPYGVEILAAVPPGVVVPQVVESLQICKSVSPYGASRSAFQCYDLHCRKQPERTQHSLSHIDYL